MCGISGIIGNNWDDVQLKAMLDIQHHRGPDFSDCFINLNKYAGLGHNRLSIIDLSAAANCPMHDESNQLTIIFNGEIYNYIQLRKQLTHYRFKSNSDTEVILAAYAKWGEGCTEKLIGMYSFAIWDENRQKLFCSRDRLGIKPFYYHLHDGQLIFASEIKSILATGINAEPNWNAWSDYLIHGYLDHNNETFFKNIYSLPAGTNLSFSDGKIKFSKYWDLPSVTKEINNDPDLQSLDYIYSLFESVIKDHLQSDVPLSVNLSGGLDSAILALILDTQVENNGMFSFTSSFTDSTYVEFPMVKQLNLSNFESIRHITSPQSIPQLATDLTWFQEAPFGGIPSIAYFDLHKTIRKYGGIVSLEGQGLDELFGGYEYAKNYYYADLVTSGKRHHHGIGSELESIISQKLPSITRILNGQPLSLNHDGTQHLNKGVISKDLHSISPNAPVFASPYEDHLRNVLYKDLMHTKLPRVLRMNDKLSMANGIELRVPFLDHRIVEFAFILPGESKIKNNEGKFILRRLAEHKSSIQWHNRPKNSIVTPQTPWLQNDLSEWVLDLIHSKSFKERGLFDHPSVDNAYRNFKNGNPPNSFYVWQWINTELWFKQLIS